MSASRQDWRWLPFLLVACPGGEEALSTHASTHSAWPAAPENLSSEACAECHPAIASEWRSSLHASAFSDPVFRAEYDPDPQAFCVGCHNPPASVSGGIDCATCHARGGAIIGHGPTAGDTEPDEESCRPCHEFGFDNERYATGQSLQRTFSEWEESPDFALGRTCLDCHMAPTDESSGAHASHRFRGFADTAFIQDAIRVQVSATLAGDEVEVGFAITSQRIGHAFPTGDVYRSLRFVVSNGEEDAEAVFARYFAFRVTEDGRGHRLEEVDDTRIRPRETRRGRLSLPATESLEWSLELHRLAPDDARRRGLSDEATRHVLFQGVAQPAAP
ncbi:MAG: hypothetical protein AB8H86_05805 [Polyangiales bacterium]